MGRFGKLLISLLLFSLCFYGARQLTGKWVSFPHLLNELGHLVGIGFSLQEKDETQSVDVDHNTAEAVTEFHSHDVECPIGRSGSVENKAPKTVYRWQDAKGRWVFSDASPESEQAEKVSLAATGKDYFDLSVNYRAGRVPTDIKNLLEIRGRGLYKIYSRYLGEDRLTKATLNIDVYGDAVAYDRIKKQKAPELADQTPGFYSWQENKAVVLYEGSRNGTQRTAIHESVHVINAELFGPTPGWLNEGLAEYFENIEISGQLIEVQPDRHWLTTYDITRKHVPLRQLISSPYSEWYGDRRSQFYGSAWLFTFFLLDSQQQSDFRGLISEVAKNPCMPFDGVEYFERSYPGGLAGLESDWRSWIARAEFQTHRY